MRKPVYFGLGPKTGGSLGSRTAWSIILILRLKALWATPSTLLGPWEPLSGVWTQAGWSETSADSAPSSGLRQSQVIAEWTLGQP